MKTFHIDCELSYDVAQQTVFMFNIAVPNTDSQTVSAETITVNDGLTVETIQAPGSPNRTLRVDVPPGPFSIRYLANVQLSRVEPDQGADEWAVADLPADVVPYLTPSRHCESDLLFQTAVAHFGDLPKGYGRVEAICRWIRTNVNYQIGTSQSTQYTANDAITAKSGVCRDFAHIGIALCRALNIPARIVTGYAIYAEPPADFHAVFEAFLGGRWILFDPTELSPVSDLIQISVGQDASDVPFATMFGQARLRVLSPLVEPATPSQAPNVLIEMQEPGAGIALAA